MSEVVDNLKQEESILGNDDAKDVFHKMIKPYLLINGEPAGPIESSVNELKPEVDSVEYSDSDSSEEKTKEDNNFITLDSSVSPRKIFLL